MRETDSLVRNREKGNWPSAEWTYQRPAMVVRDDRTVVPKQNAKILGIEQFFFLLDCDKETLDVLRVTITQYHLDESVSAKGPVQFQVVNEISLLKGLSEKLQGTERFMG